MRLKQLEKSENKIKFILEGVTPAFANSLRRAAMFNMPTLAIEDIYFTKNNSALYDEQIASRLGLTPIKTKQNLNICEECSCKGEGCKKCEIKLKLKIAGPCMVYAKNLEGKNAEPVYLNIPIALLLKDQEIDLTAVAILGRGRDHAKWSPCLVFYRQYPSVKIKRAVEAKQGMEYCPRGVFKESKVANLEACNLCKACEDHSNGAISVSGAEDKFIFTVESWGQIEPKKLLEQAIEIVKKDVAKLKLK